MAYRADSPEGRFLRGDRGAVADVSRWVARVLAMPGFWSLRNSWLDVHQETLGRVVESLRIGRFDPDREFRTYVQGIARFTAYKAIQLGMQETSPSATAPAGSDRAPDAEREAINAQLARLALELSSEECRTLIADYFLDERTYAEIAEFRGVPVGTLKSRLFRCMEAIHKRLGRVASTKTRRNPGPPERNDQG